MKTRLNPTKVSFPTGQGTHGKALLEASLPLDARKCCGLGQGSDLQGQLPGAFLWNLGIIMIIPIMWKSELSMVKAVAQCPNKKPLPFGHVHQSGQTFPTR